MGEREKKPKANEEGDVREKKPKEHDEPDVVAHIMFKRNDEADELGVREKKPK